MQYSIKGSPCPTVPGAPGRESLAREWTSVSATGGGRRVMRVASPQEIVPILKSVY